MSGVAINRKDGYVVDVPYPLHFYKEMQPTWLTYVLTTLGCHAPDIHQPYRYCELGCGAGINTLVAAACNPLGQFVGVDFNSTHIAQARSIAQQVGIENVEFIEASFEDFSKQSHVAFDFLVTHGVWSWLGAKSQMAILQIAHQNLKPQGVLYLQYMCYPGAARLVALQKVLYEVAQANGGNSAEGALQGLELLRGLERAGAGLFVDNPEISKELAALEKEHPQYIAHDFLAEYWRPQHSVDVHQMLAQIGLPYIGSASSLENMDSLSIPGNVQPILESIKSRRLQETVRDMARSQSQRTDIFQKQPKSLGASHLAKLAQFRFRALAPMPSPGAIEFNTPIGKVPGPSEIFTPLLQALKQQDCSFEQLCQLPIFAKEPGLLLQSLNMLMWAGFVHPLRADTQEVSAASKLQAWIDFQGIPLDVLAPCGTAALRSVQP